MARLAYYRKAPVTTVAIVSTKDTVRSSFETPLNDTLQGVFGRPQAYIRAAGLS